VREVEAVVHNGNNNEQIKTVHTELSKWIFFQVPAEIVVCLDVL